MSKTEDQIHYNMSKIRCKDTKIELLLRKELWNRGIRYRKNVRSIIGKPDLAFISKKVAVFCDSEFWHGYEWDVRKNQLKKNRDFWVAKIERNMERDREVNQALQAEGWTVIRFWGKEIQTNCSGCADIIESTLKNNRQVHK